MDQDIIEAINSLEGEGGTMERIHTFCALCVSRCGALATVEGDRLVALEPDPDHPTGRALCLKGKVAPELVDHPDRLLQPLRRTGPKGGDPGWEPIGWDEALDLVADRLGELAASHGPESVVFTNASPSTSALSDSVAWIGRLRKAFGSPNYCLSMELCGWGRYLASQYVFGAAVPGDYMPDLDNTGCILYWGYNPSVSRLAHATATVDALRRGAKLIVVDPRRVGMANRADQWLQVRPGTDGALALGLAGELIRSGWFDRAFVAEWTNGPLLVRPDTGRLLRHTDLDPASDPGFFVTWNGATNSAVPYDPAEGRFQGDTALTGAYDLATSAGDGITCRTVFDHVVSMCEAYRPDVVERITGVTAAQVTATARLLWEARPTAFYSWSGVEQQSGATQIARAINLLYALTGNFDAPGGNVLFASPRTGNIAGDDMLSRSQRDKALGLRERPAGVARFGHVTSGDIYRAIVDGDPYPVKGLVSFGSNLLLAHADGERGREALAGLDFHVHADVFLNPTAELADVVLPVATPFETEGLKVGFEISQAARSLIQLRRPLVPPRGEARSDVQIVFDLAVRLGLGHHFWDGDVDAGNRALLEPSGVTLEQLRARPEGVGIEATTRYRKYTEERDGVPRGFRTPSAKIELFSETLQDLGHPALPDYEEPLVGPVSRPDLTERYPLVLTSAKDVNYLETQHRALPTLRRQTPDPTVEIHPDTAAVRGIGNGDWVRIESPNGRAKARARLEATIDPGVVCGQHGWWQSCEELGAAGFEPTGPDSANYNLLIGHDHVDPVSGSVPLRANLCEVTLLDPA